MATLHTPPHSRTTPFGFTFSFHLPLAAKSNRRLIRCALPPTEWRESRRLVSVSLALSYLLCLPNDANADSLLDKYVKKKKLDPLEVYVPPVILTQLQIKDLEKTLEDDKPEYASCRSQLRSGPAGSLRINIRAVAQYASDAGNGKSAFNDVDQCLRLQTVRAQAKRPLFQSNGSLLLKWLNHVRRALEDLDSLLLRASRNDGEINVKSMKAKIETAVSALDSLLQTVPSEVLNKGKAMADIYRRANGEEEGEMLDPEIRKLESIL